MIAAVVALARRSSARLARSPRQALGAAAYLFGMASLALALKRFYSDASADELRFILAPTTWLVSGVFGRDFEFEPGAGYLSRELSILISPACAGVNFLIVAFVSVGLSLAALTLTKGRRLARLGAALGIAYGAAIIVNALRIVVSVLVAHRIAHALGLSFQSVHRWIGVVLYVSALLGVSALVSAWRARKRPESSPRARSAMVVALACYATVTIVIPLLRGAARDPMWGEHARAISLAVGACGLVLALRRASAQPRQTQLPGITESGSPT